MFASAESQYSKQSGSTGFDPPSMTLQIANAQTAVQRVVNGHRIRIEPT
jgi:hypothetical protein